MHIMSHLGSSCLARVIPSMHVHLCVASWLFSLRLSLFFYFVPQFSFQPFLMFTSEFNERSRSNPMCDFRLGTVATSDHETPHTGLGRASRWRGVGGGLSLRVDSGNLVICLKTLFCKLTMEHAKQLKCTYSKRTICS